MTAEELYDSLLLATRAKSSARTDWNDAGRRRQDWVRQFVMSYGTDENDEATVPAGSISQALVMMNDSIVRSALAVEPGTLLGDVVRARVSDSTKIRRLCRSALSRDPRPAELNAALEQLKAEVSEAETEKARQLAEARALQRHLLGLPQRERIRVRALTNSTSPRPSSMEVGRRESTRRILSRVPVGQWLSCLTLFIPETSTVISSSVNRWAVARSIQAK